MVKKIDYLYCFPVLIWILCYFIFSFDGLYGQDAYEYLRYSEAIKTFLTTGKSPGDYFWGIYYPVFGSFLSLIIQNSALSLQLVSLVSLLITSRYLEKTIGLVYKDKHFQNIPFLYFTLSPIILIHSLLVMSDLLACCFTIIAFFYFLHYLENLKTQSVLIGCLFCALALMTRYASAVVLFPISILVFKKLIKTKNYKVFAFSIPIIALILGPHLLIRSQNSLQFLSNTWLENWDILNLFRKNFKTNDGTVNNKLINLIYLFYQVLHPIFSFIGLLLIAFFIKFKNVNLIKYQKLILYTIIIYAIFLGGIPCQAKRFFILSFPFIIIFIYPMIKQLFGTFNYPKRVFIFIFVLQLSLGLYFAQFYYSRFQLEKKICLEMRKFQGKTIYIFEIDLALKGRGLKFDYQNLYFKKYKDFEINAMVLLNEKQLENQWKGKNPHINWETIQKNYVLKKQKAVYKDWQLYKIVAKK
jgi:hypothetical protein